MLEFPAACCNERVLAAQTSRRLRRTVAAELAAYIYGYPGSKLPNMDDDAPGDFFLFCHKKIPMMIDRFEDRGKPFEHYVNSVLRWQLRSFLRSRNQAVDEALQHAVHSSLLNRDALGRRQRAFDPAHGWKSTLPPVRPRAAAAPRPRPRAPEQRLADPPALPAAGRTPRSAPVRRRRARRFRLPKCAVQRRLLYLLLKIGHRLDERQFASLVAATGCHPDSLARLLARMERATEPAQERRTMLRERRNHAFAEFQYWSNAAWFEVDPPFRARAQRRAARFHAMLVKSQSELARVRTAPSNRAIADVLGIPKGTVDTGLHWLQVNNGARYLCPDGVGSGQQQSA